MRRVLGFFFQRWFVSLLGIAALALLVWYLGPLIEVNDYAVLAGERTRVVAILVLFGLWLANVIRKQVTIRLTNANLVEELVGKQSKEKPAGPADEEIALLRERLEGALGTLKKARLGTGEGRQYLYQLPWYIIIGPPGCGKTTALRNSGIRFPLAEEMGTTDIQGVGGTRNCDWFFTDEAVLLDTAGRYATQDSDSAADSAAWLGFLDLLKKYRKRRPINGVIVAISVPELLDQGESGRAHHARAIRQRLQELQERFQIRLPVYVLFTKCDLLPGFIEFFDDLDREERAQVWGFTLPEECIDDPKGVTANFEPELELLEQRLHVQLLDRMQRESSREKRSLIFGFPQQFAALKPVVDAFLKETFRSSRFETEMLIRGVYFGSGTQEGMPIDRLLGSLSESFGLERSVESQYQDTGRSYFITSLLREVVFEEAGLAGTNLRAERQRTMLQYAAYAGVVIAIGGAALAWWLDYRRNVEYVKEVDLKAQEVGALVADLRPAQTKLLGMLPVLNAVRDIPGGHGDRSTGLDLSLGLDLDQQPKLGTEAEEAYKRVLLRQFLPRVLIHLEEELQNSEVSRDVRYETLKAYRMLDDAEHYDRDFLSEWIGFLWEDSFSHQMTDELAKDARGHLNSLLDLFAQGSAPVEVRLNESLARKVSFELSRVPVSEQAYGRIKRSPVMQNLPSFDPLTVAGTEAPLVLTRVSGKPMSAGLPGMYTRRGYTEFLQALPEISQYLASDRWVLGEYAQSSRMVSAEAVATGVGRLYAKDYIEAWRGLLSDIEIAEFANIAQAVQALNVLSNPATSPMIGILKGVRDETTLELKLEALEQSSGKAGKLLAGAKGLIAELRGGREGTRASSEARQTPGAIIEREFSALNAQVRGAEGAPAPVDRTLSVLNDLWIATNALESASGGELMAVARQRIEEATRRVDLEAARQPRPMSRWIRSIAENTKRVVAGGVQTELTALWRASGEKLCREAISGRYPIVPGAQQEIALDDFTRFFGRDGVMEKFFEQHLKPFVDTSSIPWRPRLAAARGPSIPIPTLEQFRRAEVIRRAFFAGGTATPQVEFELTPITMSPDIATFVLNLEGQVVTYKNDFVPPRRLQWPGEGLGQVSIQRTLLSGQTASDSLSGHWAWFRMLDKADVSATQSRERFKVVFSVGDREIEYQLVARSVESPFKLPELERFQCPSRF